MWVLAVDSLKRRSLDGERWWSARLSVVERDPMRAGEFDLLIVGSGPAGEKAAAQAAYFGRRVAVMDRSPDPGGALVASAVTTKAMREAALYLTGFKRHEIYGVSLELDSQAVIDRLRTRSTQVAQMMTAAVREN